MAEVGADEESEPGRVADAALAHRAFALALAVGVLLHELQFGSSPLGLHGLVVVAAVALLVQPASVPRFLALLGAVAIEMVADLPDPWNHTMFLGLVGLAALGEWLRVGPLGRRTITAAELHLRLGPLLRTGFVLVWSFAAISKLNEAFFDSPDSCAVWLVEQVPLVAVPDELGSAVVLATVAVELAVPVLLLLRPFRPVGIGLGWGFHLVASLAGHTAFSGIAWSMYLLFLDDRVLADVANRAARWGEGLLGTARRAWTVVHRHRDQVGVVLLAGLVGYLLVLQAVPPEVAQRGRRWLPAALYLVWTMAWAGLLVAVGRRRGFRGMVAPVRWGSRSPVVLAGIGVLVLNGASPYLGAKTLSSFTMYSGLRTEPGAWNHLLVPETVRVLGWQDDLVHLDEAHHPDGPTALDEVVGHQVPALGVRVRAADARQGTTVSYRHGVRRLEGRPLSEDSLLGGPVAAWHRALGAMRTHPPERRCQV